MKHVLPNFAIFPSILNDYSTFWMHFWLFQLSRSQESSLKLALYTYSSVVINEQSLTRHRSFSFPSLNFISVLLFRQIWFSHEPTVSSHRVGVARQQEARELSVGGQVLGRRRQARSRRLLHHGRRVCRQHPSGKSFDHLLNSISSNWSKDRQNSKHIRKHKTLKSTVIKLEGVK